LRFWYLAFFTIQDDPFIVPCCLLASRVPYRRAEPKQDSFSAAEAGLSYGCSERGRLPPGPRPAEGRKRYTTKRGLTLVNAQHITASVFINDDDYGLHQDYEKWLEELAPHAPISQYRHNDTGEDNADAHLKRQVMGREVVVAVTNGRLDLRPWERIFYGEFDGRRRKRVLVKIIGE
jgi:secondary thiamine-phosphate synthase enzyme